MTAWGSDLELVARPCPLCGPSTSSTVVTEANLEVGRLDEFAFASRKRPEYMHHRLVRCGSCALVYADPAPVTDALGRAYAEAAYDSAEESSYAAATYATALAGVVAALPDEGGALDIGTGDGAFLARLLAMGVDDVAGVEPSAAAADTAPPELRSRIRLGPFRPDDFEPGGLRLVSCFQTLEHLPDPLATCRATLRLLRPGGVLAVVCHDRSAIVNRLLGRRSPIYDVEHLQLFCPPSLRRLLERSGFERVEVRPLRNRYPLRYWLRLAPVPEGAKGPLLAFAGGARWGAVAVSLPVGNLLAVGYRPGP